MKNGTKALFTEQDFEAICRLGVGGKRERSERIGRFGLGFNSVYLGPCWLQFYIFVKIKPNKDER